MNKSPIIEIEKKKLIVISEKIFNFVVTILKTYNMPTLFILFGMRFCFYTEDHEPIHVHVIAHGIEAKFNLDPEVTLVYNKGLTSREVRLAKELIEENEEIIRERWKAIFYPE